MLQPEPDPGCWLYWRYINPPPCPLRYGCVTLTYLPDDHTIVKKKSVPVVILATVGIH